METSWKIWLDEFIELDRTMHLEGKELEGESAHRYSFLRNVIESGLGVKTTIQEDNRRKEPRIPVSVPVEILWENEEWHTFTENISWGGIMITDPPHLEKGETLNLKLVMEREGLEFAGVGQVAWKKGDTMGIAFKVSETNQLVALSEIMYKLITERLIENLDREAAE